MFPERTYDIVGFPLPRSVVFKTARLPVGQRFDAFIHLESTPGLSEKIARVLDGHSTLPKYVAYSAANTSEGLCILFARRLIICDTQDLNDLVQCQAQLQHS